MLRRSQPFTDLDLTLGQYCVLVPHGPFWQVSGMIRYSAELEENSSNILKLSMRIQPLLTPKTTKQATAGHAWRNHPSYMRYLQRRNFIKYSIYKLS